MPSPLLAFRRQLATLWQANAFDEFGQPTVGPPQEIWVRWKYVRKEAVSKDGNPITINATAVVERQIEPGSIMWLGSLAQWEGSSGSSSGSAAEEARLMEVISCPVTPDLKNRFVRRTVEMSFYRGTLPNLTVS